MRCGMARIATLQKAARLPKCRMQLNFHYPVFHTYQVDSCTAGTADSLAGQLVEPSGLLHLEMDARYGQ